MNTFSRAVLVPAVNFPFLKTPYLKGGLSLEMNQDHKTLDSEQNKIIEKPKGTRMHWVNKLHFPETIALLHLHFQGSSLLHQSGTLLFHLRIVGSEVFLNDITNKTCFRLKSC